MTHFILSIVILSLNFVVSSLCTAQIVGGSITSPDSRHSRLDWDFDGKRILGHQGETVYVWSAESGQVLLEKKLKAVPIILRFDASYEQIISVTEWGLPIGGDCWEEKELGGLPETEIWNARTGQQLARFPNQVFAAMRADGQYMLSYSVARNYDPQIYDHTSSPCPSSPKWTTSLVEWDMRSKSQRLISSTRDFTVPSRSQSSPPPVGFSASGSTFYALGTLWSSANAQAIKTIPANSWTFGQQDDLLYAFGVAGTNAWNADGKKVNEIGGPPLNAHIWESSWAPDGTWVAGLVEKAIKSFVPVCALDVYKTVGGLPTSTVPARCGRSPIMVSPKGGRLIFEGPSTAFLFDPVSGRVLNAIDQGNEPLCFSPDGESFLIGGDVFAIFDSISGRRLRSIKLSTTESYSLLGGWRYGLL